MMAMKEFREKKQSSLLFAFHFLSHYLSNFRISLTADLKGFVSMTPRGFWQSDPYSVCALLSLRIY